MNGVESTYNNCHYIATLPQSVSMYTNFRFNFRLSETFYVFYSGQGLSKRHYTLNNKYCKYTACEATYFLRIEPQAGSRSRSSQYLKY